MTVLAAGRPVSSVASTGVGMMKPDVPAAAAIVPVAIVEYAASRFVELFHTRLPFFIGRFTDPGQTR